MSLAKFLPWRSAAASSPPFLLRYRSSTFFIVTTISVATFTDIFLYALIVPVMPFALTSRAGIAEDQIQRWNTILVACYGIALFFGSPIAGIFADHTSSRRTPLTCGLVALAASTLLLCLGRSVAVFAVGRVLQGFSAAVVWSVGLALLADTMGSNIGLAMGYVSISISAGLLFAPLIGGAVYAGAGYYAVYYVAFGLIALDIVMRLLLIEKKTALRWLKKEEAVADADAASEAPPATTADAETQPRAGTFQRMCILLRSKRMLASLVGCAINAGIYTAFDTILPIFTESMFHWKSTAAGLIFFALYTPPLILSPPVGIFADRYGAKWPAVCGFALTIPLLVCLRFVDHNNINEKVTLGALLTLLGLVITFSNVPLMAEIGFIIETEEQRNPGVWGAKGVYGIGYGLYTTAFALGSSVGSLMAGYIQQDYSWSAATWALSIWAAVGLVLTLGAVGEFKLRPPPQAKAAPVLSDELLTPSPSAAGKSGKSGKAEKETAA